MSHHSGGEPENMETGLTPLRERALDRYFRSYFYDAENISIGNEVAVLKSDRQEESWNEMEKIVAWGLKKSHEAGKPIIIAFRHNDIRQAIVIGSKMPEGTTPRTLIEAAKLKSPGSAVSEQIRQLENGGARVWLPESGKTVTVKEALASAPYDEGENSKPMVLLRELLKPSKEARGQKDLHSW